ncbi:MAG: putative peptidoglycan glycosyltransferase FtsW [Planctomycetota bacterium]
MRYAHILMAAAAGLLALAVVMTRSAGLTVGSGVVPADERWDAILRALGGRHALFALMAVAAMWVGSRVDVRGVFGFARRLDERPMGPRSVWDQAKAAMLNPLWLMVLGSLVLVGLTFLPGVGRSVNGSSRWVAIGGFSFQPSELLKWTMIVAIAWWCARRAGVMHRFFHGLLPPLLLIGFGVGMVIVEDLGTGVLIGAVAVAMLMAGGARWWQVAMLIPVGAAGVIGLIVTSPYRVQRLLAFLDPWADPRGIGYHPIQSLLAFAHGGVTGTGLGNGVRKYHLPEDTTDFLFPIVAEELGLPGAALVIALILVILWVGLGIVTRCRDAFSRLLGLGVLLTIGGQAVMNIAVVTVVVPTKGIALPLLSAGGTGWCVTGFMLGLVASLDNAAALEEGAAERAAEEAESRRRRTERVRVRVAENRTRPRLLDPVREGHAA